MSWRRIGESALQVDNFTMSYIHLDPICFFFLSCSRKHFLFNRSLKPEGLTQLCSAKDICPSPFTFLSCTHSLHLCGVIQTLGCWVTCRKGCMQAELELESKVHCLFWCKDTYLIGLVVATMAARYLNKMSFQWLSSLNIGPNWVISLHSRLHLWWRICGVFMETFACDGLPDCPLKRAETGFLEALIRLNSPPT